MPAAAGKPAFKLKAGLYCLGLVGLAGHQLRRQVAGILSRFGSDYSQYAVFQIVHGVHLSLGRARGFIKFAVRVVGGCPPASGYDKRKIYILGRIHYLEGRNSEVKHE